MLLIQQNEFTIKLQEMPYFSVIHVQYAVSALVSQALIVWNCWKYVNLLFGDR